MRTFCFNFRVLSFLNRNNFFVNFRPPGQFLSTSSVVSKKIVTPEKLDKYLFDDREEHKIGRRISSHGWSRKWLVRQVKDPYVKMRQFDDYRARSAYKLIELDDEYKFLRPGMVLVDCGAAPGSWTQVLVRRTTPTKQNGGKIIAVDKELLAPLEGATMLGGCDFMTDETRAKIFDLCGGEKTVDGVLSDMAPSRTGIAQTDHERIMVLAYSALAFAVKCLKAERGTFFLCKIFSGREREKFFVDVKRFFQKTTVVKPDASRDESSEVYFLARHFKGLDEENK